jgi:hypothetical protein
MTASSQEPPSDPMPLILRSFNAYMQLDPDCILPCWHGINLEEESSEKVLGTLLSQFDEKFLLLPNAWLTGFAVSSTDTNVNLQPYALTFSIGFGVKDDRVTSMSAYFNGFTQPHPSGSPNQLLSGYSIYNVISSYGAPSEIYIDHGWPRVAVYLAYEDLQMTLRYEFSFMNFYDDIEDNVLSACLTTENLYIFEFHALNEERYSELITTADEFFDTIDEVTPFTVESFSEALQENPALCVDIFYEE